MLKLIVKKLDELIKKVDDLSKLDKEPDRWMNITELCDYLPSHPSKGTVYSWVAEQFIPHHRLGRASLFRKSEIDQWLLDYHVKSTMYIEKEASTFINDKKLTRKAPWRI